MSFHPTTLDILRYHAGSWTWTLDEATGCLVGERAHDGHTQRLVLTCPLRLDGFNLPITGRLTAGRIVLVASDHTTASLVRGLERELAAALRRGLHTASDEMRVRPYAERYGEGS